MQLVVLVIGTSVEGKVKPIIGPPIMIRGSFLSG